MENNFWSIKEIAGRYVWVAKKHILVNEF